ncbi:MAG: acyl-CoA dehydrogenase family protein [Anaerolineales bacterium]
MPVANRPGGAAGCDFDILLASMRIANAATAVGVANAAFEYSMNYAKEREAFGMKIAQKQAIAFMLAEMRTEIEAMRLLDGKPRGSWTWGAKTRERSVSRVHWRGGYGDDGHRPRGANSRRAWLHPRASR